MGITLNSVKLQKFVHGGDIYSADSPLGYWLDFSANINPLGLADSVKKAIMEHIDGLVHYPDPKGRALKQAIADCCGVPVESVVLGNGAAELFYVYFHAERPAEVLLPVPSFSEYERAAHCSGAAIRYFFLREEQSFHLDFAELAEAVESCRTVVLGNPNNPTGELLSREAVEDFVSCAAEQGVDVIVDESFLDFRQDKHLYTVCDLTGKYANLLVISSMTKAFAIPGIRLGYAIAGKRMVSLLEAHKDTWNVNSLAQAAGIAALSDTSYREQTLSYTGAAAEKMYRELRDFSRLMVYRPTVNFVLINIEGYGMTSEDLTAGMKHRGILVRDCSNYPGLDNRFVRVAVRSSGENSIMLEALRECLGDKK